MNEYEESLINSDDSDNDSGKKLKGKAKSYKIHDEYESITTKTVFYKFPLPFLVKSLLWRTFFGTLKFTRDALHKCDSLR